MAIRERVGEPRRSLQGRAFRAAGERRPTRGGWRRKRAAADPLARHLLGLTWTCLPNGKDQELRRAGVRSWLSKHHDRETEIWLKVHKKDSACVGDLAQASDVALCWGWIDGIPEVLRRASFLQRYTPRKAKEHWSQIKTRQLARLTEADHDAARQRQIDAAKADGRWPRPTRADAQHHRATVPPPAARDRREHRGAQDVSHARQDESLALTFRTNNMKDAEGRARQSPR